MSPKDWNSIKSALRRCFARSELHAMAEATNRVSHSDPAHPRCKKWSWCNACGEVVPTWRTAIDHIEPLVPLHKHYSEMTIDEVIKRLWCELSNLQTLCLTCHTRKSTIEAGLRPKPVRRSKRK